MKKKKAKQKRQKRVLVASVLMATFIIAGTTFAWFTSKDEVTNQLSAQNNYGVTITETFAPPTQWYPGEEVEKVVSAVNTGNIDAFVKLSLSNYINLKVSTTGDSEYTAANVADYVTLSSDEVKSLQAGGMLVCEAGSSLSGDDQKVGTGYEAKNTGLYIFRRNMGDNADVPQYAGYYYVKGASSPTDDKYYAITATNATTATIDKTTTVEDGTLTLDYSAVGTAKYVKATYTGEAGDDDNIVIYINLANDWQSYWSYNETEQAFYYNYILGAGKTSYQLVESVTLDKNTSEDAYINMDYFLTVDLDSVQIATGDDKAAIVDSAWTPADATVGDGDAITWTFRE